MNAVNLGIVFGPTLIRPKHEHSSSSIVHINHHSMITQLLIENPAVFIVSLEVPCSYYFSLIRYFDRIPMPFGCPSPTDILI